MFETLSIGAFYHAKNQSGSTVRLWQCRSLHSIWNAAASQRGESQGVLLLGYERQEKQGGFTLQKGIVSVTGAETMKTFSSMRREQERHWSGERPVPLQGHQCTVTVLDHKTSPSVEGARQDTPRHIFQQTHRSYRSFKPRGPALYQVKPTPPYFSETGRPITSHRVMMSLWLGLFLHISKWLCDCHFVEKHVFNKQTCFLVCY